MKVRKKILIAFLFLLIIVLIMFLKSYLTKTEFQADDVNGNTSGNLINGGLFCELDNHIYFSNLQDDGALYVMNNDLSNSKKIINDKAAYINGAGKYIIYSRVNNTKEENSQNILVFNSVGIYRIDRSGSNIKLLDENPAGLVNVYGNFVYFQQYTVENNLQFYRVKIDGSEHTRTSKESILPSSITKNTLYYAGVNNDHNIHAMDLSNFSSRLLSEGNCFYPIVNGDYLYYISLSDGYAIVRMKLDTGEKTILVKEHCSTFNITNSDKYLYYQVDDTENNRICRMNLETKQETIIKKGNFNHIHVTSNYIFFQEYNTSKTFVLPTGEEGEATEFVLK